MNSFPHFDSLSVVYQNDDFLVVDKPALLLVHPTRPGDEVTLLGLLQKFYPHSFYALVNRLDRETSGLVLVAKSSSAASLLGKMWMRREVVKIYRAIVRGVVDWEHLRIEKPLGRLGLSASNPIHAKQAVLDYGEPAISECWTMRRGKTTSLLKIQLETGKLHQIRVHLDSVGYPVLGDKLYGVDPNIYLGMCEGRGYEEHMPVLKIRRHALHACELQFTWEGSPLHLQAPMPHDLEEWIQDDQ